MKHAQTKSTAYWYLEYVSNFVPRVAVYRSYADADTARRYLHKSWETDVRITGPHYYKVPV